MPHSENFLQAQTLAQNRLLRSRRIIRFALSLVLIFLVAGLVAQAAYWSFLPKDLPIDATAAKYQQAQKINAALAAAVKQYGTVKKKHIPISEILVDVSAAKAGQITKLSVDQAMTIRIEGTTDTVEKVNQLVDGLHMQGYAARLERITASKGIQTFQLTAVRGNA